MPRKIVDISVPLENGVAADPPGYGPTIEYHDHRQTAPEVVKFFPGLSVDDLPDHGSQQARHHHRRGAARLVFPARRET